MLGAEAIFTPVVVRSLSLLVCRRIDETLLNKRSEPLTPLNSQMLVLMRVTS
jgi:hypothetical protein